ncbi:HD domain-containing protein [Empedobacter falsenii]|uniref:HD domain-containing protein n=1 Tax=Empedobacter falsenii TaxID=343874 RepID=A0A376G6Y6_9FLAO|nr:MULTISPECIES: HD domain-containing protein [Empedobacter]MDM1042035.1 HD domain-containing protein [Empedobacter brevis]MDM1062108.1 HD domain-containing protein [Empedobacter falsenii]MDM1136090.1 HD domain-containing protein [Empedobacter sp. R750]MDM1550932.1 HD domain-containing protein [Empedobacter falsenii]STD55500.1 Multifunctional CCA protein [Empedobacter falsenii]
MKILEAVSNPIFKNVAEVADEINQETYVVGGFVRDYLLNRGQKKDIDFVTVGNGILLAKELANKLGHTSQVSVFKRFGTAMFKYKDTDLEFVGARKESYSEDSRKPHVEDGTLEDDQKRRDFTINTLAISMNKENFGELIDPFNGVEDLNNKIIKTPLEPNVTYSDDPLRMMRAIRFAAQLEFEIEKKSFQAIIDNAERINIVSFERVMDEFQKIMMTDKPSVGLLLLEQSGLMQHILPELVALKGIEEVEGQKHKDNFYHTLEVVDNISVNTDNVWLRWAALLHDIGKAVTKRFDKNVGWTFHSHEFVGSKMVLKLFRRLKLPLGPQVKYVQKLVMMSSRPIAVVTDDATDSALRRLLFDAGEDFDDLITLCKADITTKNERKQKRFKQNFEVVEQKIKDVEERDRVRNFQPPISGEEIMKIFDIQPGKEIGILKNAIKEAILEGEVENNYNSALEFVINMGKDLNLEPKNI